VRNYYHPKKTHYSNPLLPLFLFPPGGLLIQHYPNFDNKTCQNVRKISHFICKNC
jgi:hypothetical protein